MSARNPERQSAMIARHLKGETLTDIGRDYGLTRERVRQIVRAGGVSRTESATVRRAKRTRTCAVCGEPFFRYVPGKHCSSACQGIAARKGENGHPGRYRSSKGHWACRDPRTEKTMRYERYMAQNLMGRALRRNEWVTLRDDNPDNLTPSNIEVRSQSAVLKASEKHQHHARTLHRYKRREAEPLPDVGRPQYVRFPELDGEGPWQDTPTIILEVLMQACTRAGEACWKRGAKADADEWDRMARLASDELRGRDDFVLRDG